VHRRPDRPGPCPQLGGHELDLVEGGGSDALSELLADRLEQEVARRGDAATDDHPIGRDDRDHVGDADPEVAPDDGQSGEGSRVAGLGGHDGRLGRGRPAGGGDAIRPGERLETAMVPAATRRAVGVDRLMADLTGRAVVAELDAAVDGDHAADPGSERQADDRSGASPGPQA
jgi:hypothetical protein